MRWSREALEHLLHGRGENGSHFRILVAGGYQGGFLCEGFWTFRVEDRDICGQIEGFGWVCDPVSWQFVEHVEWSMGDEPATLLGSGLQGIGAGPLATGSSVRLRVLSKPQSNSLTG